MSLLDDAARHAKQARQLAAELAPPADDASARNPAADAATFARGARVFDPITGLYGTVEASGRKPFLVDAPDAGNG